MLHLQFLLSIISSCYLLSQAVIYYFKSMLIKHRLLAAGGLQIQGLYRKAEMRSRLPCRLHQEVAAGEGRLPSLQSFCGRRQRRHRMKRPPSPFTLSQAKPYLLADLVLLCK